MHPTHWFLMLKMFCSQKKKKISIIDVIGVNDYYIGIWTNSFGVSWQVDVIMLILFFMRIYWVVVVASYL